MRAISSIGLNQMRAKSDYSPAYRSHSLDGLTQNYQSQSAGGRGTEGGSYMSREPKFIRERYILVAPIDKVMIAGLANICVA